MVATPRSPPLAAIYYFCRIQRPLIPLSQDCFIRHLRRMHERAGEMAWEAFLAKVEAADAFLAAGCIENIDTAWEQLFAARAGRADRLLIDALRARAARLYPQDPQAQDTAVHDFWGHLLLAPTDESTPILARYDGLRPLVPWLIRVFQNRQISQLRSPSRRGEAIHDDDQYAAHDILAPSQAAWHEAFCDAARGWLATLSDNDLIILGLRWRYRLSQREAAEVLRVHEGTVSRQIDKLRDRCLAAVSAHLEASGWTGEDLQGYVLREMAGVLLDEPRLGADHLGRLLRAQGITMPAATEVI